MPERTIAQLTAEANVIGNETGNRANTTDRVRDMLINIIDSMSVKHDRGDWAGTTDFPETGGTGTGGAVAKFNRWTLTSELSVGGNVYSAGTIIEAGVDSPGQTLTNWIKYAVQL